MNDDDKAKLEPEVIQHEVKFPEPNRNNHDWKQRGFTMHCDGKGHHAPHGYHLHPDEHLTGMDSQGMPIIEKITVHDPQNVA